MMLGGKKGLACKFCIEGIRLEQISEFKYLGCVLDESGTDEAECSRKVASRRMVAVNAKSLPQKLKKVFSDGSAMWREWRMTGLLRGSI